MKRITILGMGCFALIALAACNKEDSTSAAPAADAVTAPAADAPAADAAPASDAPAADAAA